MGKIKLLAEHIISKIAAGEVIERPSFAVKELIDNAIDANADNISVSIEDSGLKKISVIDNGEGMDSSDIQKCFKRHTTSKIFEETDLTSIKTLGFRGEALCSLAAVSNMTIKSKVFDETAGTIVEINGGTLKNISPIGMPFGTNIVIDNLFDAIPARKKFLKSKRTEFRHIVDTVTSFALAYPNIRFSLSHNKKLIFDFAKSQNLWERIKEILGSEIYNNLIPIKNEESYIKMSGFISKPQIATQGQQKNFIFVNKRRVTDRLITLAVKEAYGNLLESTSYPVFLLFLDLPYEAVDVNIHPRKEQVSFIDNKIIFDAIVKVVKETLSENNITFFNLSWKEEKLRGGGTTSYAGKLLKETVTPWSLKDIAKITKFDDIKLIHNLYIIVQTKKGILIVDQHAAHERILYEQFLEEFKKQKQKKKTYKLRKQIIFDLSISDTEVLLENISLFGKLGFKIEHVENKTFKLIFIPVIFKDRDTISFIQEIIDSNILEVLRGKGKENLDMFIDVQSKRMVSYLACRSAVKAGDRITKKEGERLLKKLTTIKNNTTCPHGRPTQIEITIEELNRMFKR